MRRSNLDTNTHYVQRESKWSELAWPKLRRTLLDAAAVSDSPKIH